MLKLAVQVHNEGGFLIAEFWDCFRLDPAPVQELRKKYEAHLAAKGRPQVVIDLLGVGFALILGDVLPKLSERGHFITFCDDESYPVFYPELYRRFDTGIRSRITWNRSGCG